MNKLALAGAVLTLSLAGGGLAVAQEDPEITCEEAVDTVTALELELAAAVDLAGDALNIVNPTLDNLRQILDATPDEFDNPEAVAALEVNAELIAALAVQDAECPDPNTPPTDDEEPPVDPGADPLAPSEVNFRACEINSAQFIERLELLSTPDAQAVVNELGDRGILLVDTNPDTARFDLDQAVVAPLVVNAFDDFKRTRDCNGEDNPPADDDDSSNGGEDNDSYVPDVSNGIATGDGSYRP